MLKPENKEFVALTWRDPHGRSDGISVHEMPHCPIIVTTYGWLMRQDDAGISIAAEWCSDQTMRQYTFVLASLIDSIEVIIPLKKVRAARVKKTAELVIAEA